MALFIQWQALVLSGRNNPSQLQLGQREGTLCTDRLGTLLSLLCSQADTQFYTNKHEIDSKDQIQRACSWKCAFARQGV